MFAHCIQYLYFVREIECAIMKNEKKEVCCREREGKIEDLGAVT